MKGVGSLKSSMMITVILSESQNEPRHEKINNVDSDQV